jgi:hypothetical protein
MKKTLCLYFAFLSISITFAAKIPFSSGSKKAGANQTTITNTNINSTIDGTAQISSVEVLKPLTLSDLQTTLGRKLTIKEKVSWWLYKKKFVHIDPSEKEIKNANSNAVLGFVFGILGLVGLSFLAAIPGLILSNKALAAEKADPGILKSGNSGLAKAGQILSWVGIGLFLITLIYVLAIISSLH